MIKFFLITLSSCHLVVLSLRAQEFLLPTASTQAAVSVSTPAAAPSAAPAVTPSTPTAKPAKEAREYATGSGLMLTPTAYRGNNQEGLGPSLDINMAYYIGRLYGKNRFDWTSQKTNFIDRVGVLFISVDGKIQIQTEGKYRPAMAVGVQGIQILRDASPNTLNTQTATIKPTDPANKTLSGGYISFGKKFFSSKLGTHLGYMRGNTANQLSFLSEFLTPQALTFSGHPGQEAKADSMLFGGINWVPTPKFPIQIEYMKPLGMPLSPYLINFRVGKLFRINFDVALLKFDGGYDLLGMFNFRYTYYPPPLKRRKTGPSGILK